jgi:protein-S-isoprenylcysteine O-methyltransferase Ste14
MSQEQPSKRGLAAFGLRRAIQLVVLALLLGALLFGLGRWDWIEGWLFFFLYMAYVVGILLWLSYHDPGLLEERGMKMAPDVPLRERLILLAIFFLTFAMIGVATLDSGRMGWSEVPLPVQVVAWLIIIPAAALPAWALVVNTYASTVSRIQSERDQRVIRDGPYRYLRHPLYAGAILFELALPVALGSWWALIPGALATLLFIIRTTLEERMLRANLAGYDDYRRQTRYRLLPGVW